MHSRSVATPDRSDPSTDNDIVPVVLSGGDGAAAAALLKDPVPVVVEVCDPIFQIFNTLGKQEARER